ncbi:MAG: zinc ribbon domain-containing protein [Planctomycetota bacterium]|nr:MAG: zinc ribbon domain-containing protein [Planctomycetota bacterium]
MPVYEYRCKKCGQVSSFLEKSGGKKTHACEKCGSKDTEKVFSTFSAKSSDSSSCSSSCPTGTCPFA